MRIVKIDHIVLFVENMEESIRFYKVLGFQTANAKDRYELTAGDFRIHLYAKGKPSENQPEKIATGAADICIEIDSGIEMLRDYLASQGLKIKYELSPRSGVRGAMRSFFLSDPDGNLIEVASYNN